MISSNIQQNKGIGMGIGMILKNDQTEIKWYSSENTITIGWEILECCLNLAIVVLHIPFWQGHAGLM